MIRLNLLNGVESVDYDKLENICKFIEGWGIKKPVEFDVKLNLYEVGPVLTVEPIKVDLDYSSVDEFKIKKKLNEKYYHNQALFNAFKTNFGYVYYKYIEGGTPDKDQGLFRLSDSQLECMLKHISSCSEKLVEIQSIKTYFIEGETGFKLNGLLKNMPVDEAAKILNISLFDYLKEFAGENFVKINEKYLYDGNNCIIFPQGESLINIKNENGMVNLKYKTADYDLPIRNDIIEFERRKIKLVMNYIVKFLDLASKSKNCLDLNDKLSLFKKSDSCSNFYIDRIGVAEYVNHMARMIRLNDETSEQFDRIKKDLLNNIKD